MNYWTPTLEDFDVAIINKLKRITIDINGDGVLQPIHVTYFTPESEGAMDRTDNRPAIVVFMYDQVHDAQREHSFLETRIDDNPTDISFKRPPTPMKFFYQFLVITEYQEHMNKIIRQLQRLFPTRGFVTVVSPSGQQLSYDFFQRSVDNGYTAQFLQFGANEQERLFRKVYRYHLFAEVDEFEATVYKKVLSVHHEATPIERILNEGVEP